MPTNMESWIPHVKLHSKRTLSSNNPFIVCRMGQLTSETRLFTGGQSVGGSNGDADELTNWDGTKKRGLGI